jgi:hypothetical protein
LRRLTRCRALAAVPLTALAFVIAACNGEDRPNVDVIDGGGPGGTGSVSVSASGADVAGPQPTQLPGAVYNVVSNVDSYFAIGLDLRDIRALVSPAAEGRRVDWAAVQALYEDGKNQVRADGSVRSLASMATDPAVLAMFPNGESVFGRANFIDAQARDTINGTGRSANTSENARRNIMDKTMLMIVYGKALQELEAARNRIAAGNLDNNTGAPHAVDEAWGAIAGALDGSGLRTYSLLGFAVARDLNFKLAGKFRNPMEAAFTNALQAAQAGDAAAFDTAQAEIRGYMNSVFYLSALRYAKTVEMQTGTSAREGGLAEGWAFWQSIRPIVAGASASAAQTVESALTRPAGEAFPPSLTAQVYAALNEPAVLAALGIPPELQVKTPPAE